MRGKVESFQQTSAGIPQSEREECRARASRYFRLALQYAACGSEPEALVVMGRVGAGKSTLARSLGGELGWEVLSADRIRKELAGVPLHVRGTTVERRRLYAKRMTDRTYAALAHHALGQLRQHRGVILDATFSSRRRRQQFLRALDQAGVACRFVEVQATTELLRKRLAARALRVGEISDARLEDFSALDRAYEPPHELPAHLLVGVKTARSSEAAVIATLADLAKARSFGRGA